MTKHGVYFVKNFATLEEAIETRDEVLRFFNEFDRLPSREEQEVLLGLKFKPRNHHRVQKHANSNTGQLHITFNEPYDRYQIQLTRNRTKFSEISHSLEEAIAIRDEVLKFYEDHGRLQSKSECFEAIKKGTNL